MGEYVRIDGMSEVSPGSGLAVEINGRSIAIFNGTGLLCPRQHLCPSRWSAERRRTRGKSRHLPLAQLGTQRANGDFIDDSLRIQLLV